MHRNDLINRGFKAITPSDTTALDLCGLLVGGAGNVAVVDELGVTTTIAVQAGQQITGRIVRVNATNTTATGLVGLVP